MRVNLISPIPSSQVVQHARFVQIVSFTMSSSVFRSRSATSSFASSTARRPGSDWLRVRRPNGLRLSRTRTPRRRQSWRRLRNRGDPRALRLSPTPGCPTRRFCQSRFSFLLVFFSVRHIALCGLLRFSSSIFCSRRRRRSSARRRSKSAFFSLDFVDAGVVVLFLRLLIQVFFFGKDQFRTKREKKSLCLLCNTVA